MAYQAYQLSTIWQIQRGMSGHPGTQTEVRTVARDDYFTGLSRNKTCLAFVRFWRKDGLLAPGLVLF